MNEWKKVRNVNRENYTDYCKAFIAILENKQNREEILASARFDRHAPNLSINPRQHPEQWAAWSGYLGDKKILTNYTKAVTEMYGLNMSVPAPYPTDFDASYIPRQR